MNDNSELTTFLYKFWNEFNELNNRIIPGQDWLLKQNDIWNIPEDVIVHTNSNQKFEAFEKKYFDTLVKLSITLKEMKSLNDAMFLHMVYVNNGMYEQELRMEELFKKLSPEQQRKVSEDYNKRINKPDIDESKLNDLDYS